MYFKDVVTELTESLMSKKDKVCKDCNLPLKRQGTISHYIDVSVVKIASCFIGGAVPAPDYRYVCPKCKSVYFLVDGKFKKVPGTGKKS